jgi:hypothetical protein
MLPRFVRFGRGLAMGIHRTALGAFLAVVAATMVVPPLRAAAPNLLDPDPKPAASFEYVLDTVLVVHNWVLCVSQPEAESIARAREQSATAAEKVYAELAAAKSCGRFAKLGVMLQVSLYRSTPGSDYDARVFAALVNVGAGWQSAFVVAGGLSE